MPQSRIMFSHISVSVDGFVSDAGGNPGFFPVDQDFHAHILDMLSSIDGMVFGRTAYEMLAGFWPNAAGSKDAALAAEADFMNRLPKYVLTRRPLDKAWAACEAVTLDDLRRIKGASGRPLAVFAGASVIQATLEAGLLDEVRLLRQPVLLGGGLPLFKASAGRRDLRLAASRALASGAVLEAYKVAA